MIRLLFIVWGLLLVTNVDTQVINWVDKEYNADFNVYFTEYENEAHITVWRTKYKHDAKTKPGYWFWRNDDREEYDSDRVNIFQVDKKYKADYVVYLSKYSHEVELTDEYLMEWVIGIR